METIGNHGLHCPEFDDYAAVALYMQNLGTLIDEQLQEQLEALQGFMDRPTIIVTNSVAAVIADSNTYTQLWDTVVFNNSTFMSLEIGASGSIPGTPSNVIRIGSAAGAAVTVPYLRGSYSIGACTTMIATGAITAQSYRNLTVTSDDQSLAIDTFSCSASDTTYETNTGGEAQNVKFSCELERTSGVIVEGLVTHGNTASTVSISAGGFMWVTYNGPIDIIEVA